MAELVKTNTGQIQKLENGERKLSVEWMQRLGEHLDAQTTDFLKTPPKAEVATLDYNGCGYVALARFDQRMSAGPGSLLEEDAEPLGYHLVETQWLHALTTANINSLCVVRVSGDSMEDTFRDGDWVLIDRTQVRVSREGVYAMRVADTFWIKRISLNLREKLVRVISDNPKYHMDELPEDELSLIGRVVALVARKIP